jgi:hypothetical protein
VPSEFTAVLVVVEDRALINPVPPGVVRIETEFELAAVDKDIKTILVVGVEVFAQQAKVTGSAALTAPA